MTDTNWARWSATPNTSAIGSRQEKEVRVMPAWAADELAKIGQATELQITSRRPFT